jgi:hypothetical protein
MSDHRDRAIETGDAGTTEGNLLTNGEGLGENVPVSSQEARMKWFGFEDKRNRGEWRVEAIDFDDEGKVYVTIFSGPQAQMRAEEYAALMNKQESRMDRVAS